MRILVVSNLYPPHFLGGYELGCRDVVESLRARGHDVAVLTSRYGVERPLREGYVERSLRVNLPFAPRGRVVERVRTLRRELENRRLVVRACRAHRPDVVSVWNLRSLEPSLPHAAQARGYPVCYFVSDGWLADEARIPRPRFPPQRLDLRRVQFASEHLKQAALAAGQPVEEAEVVHWGVDPRRYRFATERGHQKRLLYVGRLAPEKGLDTALSVLRILADENPDEPPTLTVAGGPDDGRVRREVERLGLAGRVHLVGLLPREELAAVYAGHDVLLFPSVWAEPFSITLLEAMAAGLAVVTTITGGTPELAEDGVNCLTFAPGDAAGCAVAVRRLAGDPALARRLRENARRLVEERFTLEAMVERIERSLEAAATSTGRVSRPEPAG